MMRGRMCIPGWHRRTVVASVHSHLLRHPKRTRRRVTVPTTTGMVMMVMKMMLMSPCVPLRGLIGTGGRMNCRWKERAVFLCVRDETFEPLGKPIVNRT